MWPQELSKVLYLGLETGLHSPVITTEHWRMGTVVLKRRRFWRQSLLVVTCLHNIGSRIRGPGKFFSSTDQCRAIQTGKGEDSRENANHFLFSYAYWSLVVPLLWIVCSHSLCIYFMNSLFLIGLLNCPHINLISQRNIYPHSGFFALFMACSWSEDFTLM